MLVIDREVLGMIEGQGCQQKTDIGLRDPAEVQTWEDFSGLMEIFASRRASMVDELWVPFC